MLSPKTFLLLSLGIPWLSPHLAHSQDGSAIITLVMPPGGESVMSGEGVTGSVLGAMSGWYNPALLAAIHDRTLGDFAYSESKSSLLPSLGLPDLRHSARALSVTLRDFGPDLDLGLGLQYARTEFGEIITTDTRGNEISRSDSYEWTTGLGLGIGWKQMVYAGSNLKFYFSGLIGNSDQAARGWAADFGLRLSPLFSILPEAISFRPGISATLRNVGQAAYYNDPERSDPIPRELAGATTFDFDLWEIAWAHAFHQSSSEWLPESRGGLKTPVSVTGWGAQFLCYGIFSTELDDEAGNRHETHTGQEIIIDTKRLWLTWKRLTSAGFTDRRSELLKTFYLRPYSWMGSPFQMNPRFVLTHKIIHSEDYGIRDRQKQMSISVSL